MNKTRTRVLSAVVGLLLLFGVIWIHKIALSLAVFVLCLIGLNEFYDALSKVGYKPVKYLGYLACLAAPVTGVLGFRNSIDTYGELFNAVNYISLGIVFIIFALFAIVVFSKNRYNVADAALTLFGIVYVVLLFIFLVLTRNLNDGFFLVWFIFLGAFSTDTFAYLFGRLMGKHKVAPVISPNKTLEGSIGGVLGCIILTVLYGLIMRRLGYIGNYSIYQFIVLGLLNGTISQLGDLSASSVKRYAGIKDYGNMMPGHGGVLDRFDSILFTAPVVYFFLRFIGAA